MNNRLAIEVFFEPLLNQVGDLVCPEEAHALTIYSNMQCNCLIDPVIMDLQIMNIEDSFYGQCLFFKITEQIRGRRDPN